MAEGGGVQSVLSVGALSSELVTVSASWRALGLKLGVEEWQLKIVECDHSTCQDKLVAALDQWLKKKTDASWTDVAHALEEMREFALAMKIKEKYLRTLTPSTSDITFIPEPQTSEQSEEATALAQENHMMIKDRFAQLQMFICEKIEKRLEAKEIRSDHVLLYITNLFPPGNCIPQTSNLADIFTAITHNCLWDFWHYKQLVRIANMFGGEDPALKTRIEQYTQDLGGYKVATTMVQYVSTITDFFSGSEDDESLPPFPPPARKDQRYLRKLTLKLKIRITEQSLLYIDELWNSLAELFLLPPSTAILDKILEGSLYITWLIPCHQIPQIMERARLPEATDFFHKQRIEVVAIEGVCIYTAELQEEDLLSLIKVKELESDDDDGDDDTEAKSQEQPLPVQVTGHDVELVEESPEVICPVCLMLLRDPMQVSCCGRRFCAACINRSLAENGQCPHCNAKSSDSEVFEDKAQRQAILEVEVYCPNKDGSCKWSGELCQLEHHLNADPKKGREDQGCKYTETKCIHCSKNLPRCHIHHCPQRPFTCQYCGEYQSTYDDVINEHMHYSCSASPIRCTKCLRRTRWTAYQTHITACLADKDPLLKPLDIKNLQSALNLLQPVSARTFALAVKLIPAKASRKASLDDMLQEWLTQMDPPPTWAALAKALQELGESPLAAKVQFQQFDVPLDATAVIPVFSLPLDFILRRFSRYTKTMYFEAFPFYSHQFGYKIVLDVYPNGHDKCIGTHVSMCVHVSKGEHDDRLDWPVQIEVTIKLINQRNDSRHITRSITRSITFIANRDVAGKRRLEHLYPFIRHFKLHYNKEHNTQYLKDDTLIFRIANIKTNKALH